VPSVVWQVVAWSRVVPVWLVRAGVAGCSRVLSVAVVIVVVVVMEFRDCLAWSKAGQLAGGAGGGEHGG
jgi:hypothetical protein